MAIITYKETPTNEFRWHHKSEHQINPTTITLEQKWTLQETTWAGYDVFWDEWRPLPIVNDDAPMKTEPKPREGQPDVVLD